MVNKPRVSMGKIGPLEFIEGVFSETFSLGINSLVPIVYEVSMLGYNPNFQLLREACEAPSEIINNWWSLIGPSTLGQLSLLRGNKLLALAGFDVRLRPASEQEVEIDFDHFGDQVVGKKVDSVKTEAELFPPPIIEYLGSKFYYSGPPRLLDAVFTVRIVEGEVPTISDIRNYFTEINELKPSGYYFQNYFALVADNGHMKYVGFSDPDDFTVEVMQSLGSLKIEGEKMWFYPGGETENPIDFSAARYLE